MGLGNRSNSNTVFCRVAEGKIVISSNSADSSAVKRINKVGKEVWERFYDELSGKLVGISLREGDYNGTPTKDWNFTLDDKGTRFVLTMRYDSSYAKRLINALANVDDFSKTLCLLPWRLDETKSPTKKVMTGMSLYKGEHPNKATRIMPKYEKEQMPEMKTVVLKGVTQYDDTEICQFLEKVVQEQIVPKLKEASSDVAFDALGEEAPLESELGVGASDDLPF